MKRRSENAVKIVGLVREWYESGWYELDKTKQEESFARLLDEIDIIINTPNQSLHADPKSTNDLGQ